MKKTIRAFGEDNWFDFIRRHIGKLKSEIENQTRDYILGVDESEYYKYLIDKYLLKILEIDEDSEEINEPTISKEYSREFGRKIPKDIYIFEVSYNFKGSPILFSIIPTHRTENPLQISVDDEHSTVSFDISIKEKDPEKFREIKSRYYKSAFANIDYINQNALDGDSKILEEMKTTFQSVKSKYLEENQFFEAVQVKVNKDTEAIFTVPAASKKVIPKVKASSKVNCQPTPIINPEIYHDILDVIYKAGKSMEKKPSLYKDKDEEALRDLFLFLLETRYEGTTATGETFNKGGKTDILLKYAEDGTNLFVAECKFWSGPAELKKAINQLFDRYLTWRDSKTALLLFIQNKSFTKVLNAIKDNVVKHRYYKKEAGIRDETSFSYLFHLPDDEDKIVYLEIMAFHFVK